MSTAAYEDTATDLLFSVTGGAASPWMHADSVGVGYDSAPIRYGFGRDDIGPARPTALAILPGHGRPSPPTFRAALGWQASRSFNLRTKETWHLLSLGAVTAVALCGPLLTIGATGPATISRLYEALKIAEPIIPPSRSSDAAALLRRIASFRALDPDWAGDDTEIVSQEVVELAGTIVDAVEVVGLPLPNPSPSSDGEIGLSWFFNRDRLALTVTRDMHIVWATSINRKVEEGKDIEVGLEFSPRPLIEALRGFYEQAAGSVPLSR